MLVKSDKGIFYYRAHFLLSIFFCSGFVFFHLPNHAENMRVIAAI